jgi:lysozyme
MLNSTANPLLAFLRRLRHAAQPGGNPANPRPAAAAQSGVSAEPGFSSLDSVTCVSNMQAVRMIGADGIALIKRFEGCARLRTDGLVAAYPDPGTGAEPWTIGWGATGRDHVHGGRIGPQTVWTQAQCDDRLEQDLLRYAADVTRALGDAPVSQSQFDALVSFHYNTGAIARATLTRKHIEGDFEGAAQEFARWNRAGGKVLKGLVRRRAAEADLYLR